MMTNARATYMDASIATASPARLLVMLCERLVLDVQRGLAAQHSGDLEQTNRQLIHAQEIVMELRASLRADEFKGGQELAALYSYLHRQLIVANMRKDAGLTAHCLGIVTSLSDTWREAALTSIVPSARIA
jgi:flagellar protein FliS